MTEQEEELVHFIMCINDLNNAWNTFNSLLNQKGNKLFGPAFRYAIIEYSKPYRESRGIVKKKRRLETTYIPENMVDLHIRITDARDQIHAHTDLNILEARLYKHKEKGNKYTQISKNNINGLEETKNIIEIIKLIEKTLDNMYKKEKELETALP